MGFQFAAETVKFITQKAASILNVKKDVIFLLYTYLTQDTYCSLIWKQ